MGMNRGETIRLLGGGPVNVVGRGLSAAPFTVEGHRDAGAERFMASADQGVPNLTGMNSFDRNLATASSRKMRHQNIDAVRPADVEIFKQPSLD
ncbi:MAG: hypothetical protein AAF870_07125 [Pseudomonadota bacterium]